MRVFASWESIHPLLVDHGLEAVIARSELQRSRPGRRTADAAGTPAPTVMPTRAVGAGPAPERPACG